MLSALHQLKMHDTYRTFYTVCNIIIIRNNAESALVTLDCALYICLAQGSILAIRNFILIV